MKFLAVSVLYGVAMTLLGAGLASWRWWLQIGRKQFAHPPAEDHHDEEVLVRLQEVATRAARDEDEQSRRAEKLDDRRISADMPRAGDRRRIDHRHEPTNLQVVAKLIHAIQHLQQKLALTEYKLRDQAMQIQVHSTEARTDALTLLGNRRALDDELARRIAEFRRHGRTFSLIMADVDLFKKFNDAHGHQAGDELLRHLAKILRRKTREMDFVARYGGEEFAILLPGTILDHASLVATRACDAIEKCQFHYEEKEFRVTASFGVAEVLGDEDAGMLVTRADKALFAAKGAGRNCVFLHDCDAVQRAIPENERGLAETGLRRDASHPPAREQNGEQARPTAGSKVADSKSDFTPGTGQDVLPPIPNRTDFCYEVRNRTVEWQRGGPAFSVVLIEVNQYDGSESAGGQRARESAARAAAEFLAATELELHAMGHYAPGCFALLLRTAGLADAIRVAERLREGFSHRAFTEHPEQPRLTLSVGVAQVTTNDDSLSVLQRAEAALDAADRRGGNRAYCHDGDRCAPITAMLETMDYLS